MIDAIGEMAGRLERAHGAIPWGAFGIDYSSRLTEYHSAFRALAAALAEIPPGEWGDCRLGVDGCIESRGRVFTWPPIGVEEHLCVV